MTHTNLINSGICVSSCMHIWSLYLLLTCTLEKRLSFSHRFLPLLVCPFTLLCTYNLWWISHSSGPPTPNMMILLMLTKRSLLTGTSSRSSCWLVSFYLTCWSFSCVFSAKWDSNFWILWDATSRTLTSLRSKQVLSNSISLSQLPFSWHLPSFNLTTSLIWLRRLDTQKCLVDKCGSKQSKL